MDWQKDRIIEIGAVRFVDGDEAGSYNTFVYPGKKLPPEIIRLTGISDADLKNAPYVVEVLPALTEFLADDTITAQNAPFDINFLKSEYARQGEAFHAGRDAEYIAYDTAVLARALVPELESHGLQRLGEYFNIKGGVNHRAEDDARRCGKVLLKLAEIILDLGVSETVSAGRILGGGVTGDLFRNLAKYLSETGTAAAPRKIRPYSSNLLRGAGGKERTGSVKEVSAGLFQPGGEISRKFDNYEFRPRQLEMADDCLTALNEGKFLMAEAGTGTGKSFAYLIPSILFAVQGKKRVVISTNTKNLQEQLFEKDIPFLTEAIPTAFQAAILKGRNNYICKRKWREILVDPESALAEDERTKALALLFWVNRTSTGDIGENNGFRSEKWWGLWGKTASEAGSCLGTHCGDYETCFLQKARSQALNSHIVVVNHALVLTDVAAANMVLGDYHHLILDEAHNLEKAASTHLGKECSNWTVRAFCHKLYRKDSGGESGLLVRMRRQKLFTGEISEAVESAIIEVNRLKSLAGEFFAVVTDHAKLKSANESSNYTIKSRYGPNNELINTGEMYLGELLEGFGLLKQRLAWMTDKIITLEELDIDESPEMELASAAEEALRIKETIEDLTTAKDADWVYWWELGGNENREIQLYSAPLSPAKVLNSTLYPFLNALILSSATLTVGGSFDYFKERLGLQEAEKEVIYKDYGTPFKYDEQAVFGAPVFLPNPRQADLYLQTLGEIIVETGVRFKRGTLALFTSYNQLLQVYNMIHHSLTEAGISVMAQGVEGSRSDILRRFLKKRSVLLGTASFWEGVDAPGKALEILLIAKLPFDVPSEPLIQARSEKLEREGRNPFMEYSVPEAVIKLRQGIGRLIRSSSDKGAVIICDTRIVNSRWGEVFRNSLPGRLEIYRNMGEMLGSLGEALDN